MRIVFANKYWFLKGGAERYAFDLRDLLATHGHDVVPFAMQDKRNQPTPWSRRFVSAVATEKVGFGWQGLRTAGRMLYSFEARRKFGALLGETKPDLVHVHNIYHQISPSILPEAAKRGVPVVMTAHDYKLVAPNYSLYHDGAICERTKPAKYWEAFRHRCIKGSAAASALDALEMSLHRKLGLWKHVDRIIAPSRFMQAVLEAYGVDGKKVVHVPHFIDASAWQPVDSGEYVLFVGRLSEEKGVETLIRAAAKRRNVPVRIVGTGPEEARLKALAKALEATNVSFVGFKSAGDLRAEYAGARFVVVPSAWYEVFGLIVLEAYAAGKPVLASQIGGLAELVKDGETGIQASAGDVDDWAEKLGLMWDAHAECVELGRAARSWVEKEFAPDLHYKRIMGVYASVKR